MSNKYAVITLHLALTITVVPLAYGNGAANPDNATAGVPEVVRDYRHALDLVRHGARGAPTIEALFKEGLRTADALMHVDADHSALIEHLSDDDFNATAVAFDGFVLNRQETEYAMPDPGFFLGLAHQYGSRADRAFFTAYKHTYPDSVWQAYIQQQTDYSGCTVYGTGVLTRLYGEWTAYRERYPTQYAQSAGGLLESITSELAAAGGGCACGDAESVRKELQAFLAAYPMSPLSAGIRVRLQELDEGRSAMRFHCQMG